MQAHMLICFCIHSGSMPRGFTRIDASSTHEQNSPTDSYDNFKNLHLVAKDFTSAASVLC